MKKLLFILLILSSVLFGDIQRRQSQKHITPGYFIVPFPYSLPGIGQGVGVIGILNNLKDTQTDLLVAGFTGDVEGIGGGVKDYYILDNRLKAEIFYEYINKASFQSYNKRGMTSKKDDYILAKIDSIKFLATRLTLSYYEKMLQFYSLTYFTQSRLSSLEDKDGNTISEVTTDNAESSNIYILGFTIDYTDDKLDPRKGITLDTSLDYTPNSNDDNPNYYVSNYNLTGYIPISKHSTIVVNYFKSDSNIMKKGETDFDKVAKSLGLIGCDKNSQNKCVDYVNNKIAENKYGTSSGIGGWSRLRSYTKGRYKGAHTQFYGVEFRWNMTQETTPFDVYFMKDVRTNIQTALFYERGSVADDIRELGINEKDSYGVGLRMLTGSGLVYRFDIANGDDGSEITMIINYPWKIF